MNTLVANHTLNKRFSLPLFLLLSLFLICSQVNAEQEITVDELFNQIKQGRIQDNKDNKTRIRAFERDKSNQKQLLKEITSEKSQEEKRSASLEKTFNINNQELIKQEQALNERLGSLKELFGVIQQVSNDASSIFEHSLTRIQYPEREKFVTELALKMGQSSNIASMDEIEQLWFELEREMSESGNVVKFKTKIVNQDGETETANVTRVGVFNLISNGRYLNFIPETGSIVEFNKQPASHHLSLIEDLEDESTGVHALAIDPTRGQLLSLLVQSPSIQDRINQGGVIGYIILLLGLFAFTVAIQRMLSLSKISVAVKKQANDITQAGDNPLGRIINIYHNNKKIDVDSLELKLGEAILKELPAINKYHMLLKIIAVVAPLLGLLGTVTGMIVTFQSITLFGTGDPKLMAGGISTALVTTVLGLCVAIPTVLLHTLVSSQSKRISQILEEQSVGMVAEHSESVQSNKR